MIAVMLNVESVSANPEEQAIGTASLYVNSYTQTVQDGGWTTYGTAPYLSDVDYVNDIQGGNIAGNTIEWFEFSDAFANMTNIVNVTLEVCYRNRGGTYTTVNVTDNYGTVGTFGAADVLSYNWLFSLNITSRTTWTQSAINSYHIGFVHNAPNGYTLEITASRLNVTYIYAQWRNVESWDGVLHTIGWYSAEAWNGIIAEMDWSLAEAWFGNITGMCFNLAEAWNGVIHAMGWSFVEFWNGIFPFSYMYFIRMVFAVVGLGGMASSPTLIVWSAKKRNIYLALTAFAVILISFIFLVVFASTVNVEV
jgi:hypothetical protein